ncbi:uncharacterized protein LOC115388712 isoform X2 [Salarias fasciatus]|uniref:uncharacterized protein LOC115388712 isoform X2 n=1 Tax=Salarias fasciatus TaxID=181472 RepID=UPI001177034E|nr:uncharacterized protein LOC115388712 isoform X2 [Salarias fasciatus]
MRNLLFGVILGLLAVVFSTPVDNVTQIPTKPDDDILREVLEDGYLVDEKTPRVLTTNPPRIYTTVQPSQQPTSDSKSIEIEGSAEANAEPATTPTPTMNTTQSENSTSVEEAGDAGSVTATTQSSHSKFISSSVPPKAPSTPVVTNQATDSEDSSGDLMGNGSYGSGSGDFQNFVTVASKTTSSDTKKSTVPASFPVGEDLDDESEPGTESEKESESDIASKSDEESDKPSDKESDKPSEEESDKESDKALDRESDKESETESSTKSGSRKSRISILEMATQQQGHGKVVLNDQTPKTNAQHSRTPGWIIIVAFIVGLAALVMLCVAIATRDKWNGPPKSSQLEIQTSSSDQQREQEMTTFVSKESPRENGKAAEYTVIPLDELPENYSSH